MSSNIMSFNDVCIQKLNFYVIIHKIIERTSMCIMSNPEFKELLKLIEEQNEILSEQNVLHGEILNALDDLKSVFLATKTESTVSKSEPKETRENPCLEDVDQAALAKAINGLTNPEISVFWPKVKSPPNWVRVSIVHEDLSTLQACIKRGCLCGGEIILKKTPSAEFFTCDNVIKKGCSYRPAFDTAPIPRFITNLPPKKD